jgi:ATP-dependent RNA helicase RhlE
MRMPFKTVGLHPALVQATRDLRYTEATPVPAQAIPASFADHDLIAMAQTGAGKTLVVTPTRELVQQIDDVCLALA